MPQLVRGLWCAIGLALLILPALPLPAWTGAPDQGPIWTPHVASWGIGVLAIGVLAGLAGRLGWRAWPGRLAWPSLPPARAVPALALLVALLGMLVMRGVYAANPHLVDEIAQLFHARVFTAGRLAAPPPEAPGAFLVTHTWMTHAGWVSQYPPGHTALLALGLALRAEWLVNPVQGGMCLLLVYAVARRLYGPRTAMTAAVLWALSAWVMFMSGTYLNHVTAATLTLAAAATLVVPRRVGRWHAVTAGFLLAACAATRPLDAVAAAGVPLLWLVVHRRGGLLPWMALGGAPVMLAWGYLNWRIYGSPVTLGYTAVYGAEHGMGFHQDPWGQAYTPLTALSNMAVAVRRLHLYLYEWPIPALLPLGVWALAARPHRWRDAVIACGVVAAPVLYFFYWHSGFYIGPRFYYVTAPFLVMGSARAWRWAWASARRLPRRGVRPDVALAAAALAVVVWGWAGVLPQRWASYRDGLRTMKLHPERELAARGVRRALVLVGESWGSRVGVRLWALGVPPGLVERAYRRFDTCDLYLFVRRAEDSGWSPPETAARLQATMDTVRVAPPRLTTWPDPTVR
ncbi:MAG TPA: hypothetical protein VD793_07515, partial [Gemmatimonadales bacterium]|nr:hypothetical protein [Gemmatimonadales bacterium]